MAGSKGPPGYSARRLFGKTPWLPVNQQGANVHQDHAGWGDAVTDAGARRDVLLMKDAGFNFIRRSHEQHRRQLELR